jgi:hypothetical protein
LDLGSDISLGHVYHSSLGTGESYTKTHSFTIPRGLSGPFYVFVFTDRGNHLNESNEFNNVNYDRTSMLVNLVPPADLVVGTITVPSNASPGVNATITYTMRKSGRGCRVGQLVRFDLHLGGRRVGHQRCLLRARPPTWVPWREAPVIPTR